MRRQLAKRAAQHRRARDAEVFLRRLHELDDLLVEHDYPAISPWWWETIERFYRSGKRRLVIRKGRRVGASTIVAPRLAVAEALWGEHLHQPGSPPLVFAFLSVQRSEAAKRLRGIKAILAILGEASTELRGEAIELKNRPVVFAVVTANFRTSVGDTVAFAWLDEVARWRDEDTGANPASEVVASITPATATLPDARLFLVSSPLADNDFHASAFRLGETTEQATALCATWEANPTLTRADCEKLEPDPRVFQREYGGEPSAAVSQAFEDVDALVPPGIRERAPQPGVDYGLTFDCGEGSSATAALVFHFEHRQDPHTQAMQRVLVLDCARVITSKLFERGARFFEGSVKLIVDLAKRYHPTRIRGDRHNHSAIGSVLEQHGIDLPKEPASMALSDQARQSRELLDRVRSHSIELLDDPTLVQQFRNAVVAERGGHFVIATRDKRRQPDDLLDVVLLACNDEMFSILEGGGGDGLHFSEAEYAYSYAGGLSIHRPAYYYRIDQQGREIPVQTPVDPETERESRRERWSRFEFTPAELQELGPEGMQRILRGDRIDD